MKLQRKLALAGIFSLTIITGMVGIIRGATSLTAIPDTSWINTWCIIEITVGKKIKDSLQTISIILLILTRNLETAFIISSVASFRSLFYRRDVRHPPPATKSQFRAGRSRRPFKDPNSLTAICTHMSSLETGSHSMDLEGSPILSDPSLETGEASG